MIAPKPKLYFLVAAGLVLATYVMVSCNDNSSAKEGKTVVKPADTVDTSKMDTATTRPVKMTN
jgi:ABC-type oligopeptide transport system substrate-binding subunit